MNKKTKVSHGVSRNDFVHRFFIFSFPFDISIKDGCSFVVRVSIVFLFVRLMIAQNGEASDKVSSKTFLLEFFLMRINRMVAMMMNNVRRKIIPKMINTLIISLSLFLAWLLFFQSSFFRLWYAKKIRIFPCMLNTKFKTSMHAIFDVWPINVHFILIRTQLDDIGDLNAVAAKNWKTPFGNLAKLLN